MTFYCGLVYMYTSVGIYSHLARVIGLNNNLHTPRPELATPVLVSIRVFLGTELKCAVKSYLRWVYTILTLSSYYYYCFFTPSHSFPCPYLLRQFIIKKTFCQLKVNIERGFLELRNDKYKTWRYMYELVNLNLPPVRLYGKL